MNTTLDKSLPWARSIVNEAFVALNWAHFYANESCGKILQLVNLQAVRRLKTNASEWLDWRIYLSHLQRS